MTVKELIESIRALPNCRLYTSTSLDVRAKRSHAVPDDVFEFYSYCSGVDLFVDKDYPYFIVPPSEFVPANPVILGDYTPQLVDQDDISHDWYIIATDADGQYITIDLNLERLGRCYDSFFGRHAIPSETQIIALSFTDLLTRLVENKGGYPYWLSDSFQEIGLAYE